MALKRLLKRIDNFLYHLFIPKSHFELLESMKSLNETLSHVIRGLGYCPDCEQKLSECKCLGNKEKETKDA